MRICPPPPLVETVKKIISDRAREQLDDTYNEIDKYDDDNDDIDDDDDK